MIYRKDKQRDNHVTCRSATQRSKKAALKNMTLYLWRPVYKRSQDASFTLLVTCLIRHFRHPPTLKKKLSQADGIRSNLSFLFSILLTCLSHLRLFSICMPRYFTQFSGSNNEPSKTTWKVLPKFPVIFLQKSKNKFMGFANI